LAFTVLELSSQYPDEGGCYVWSKRTAVIKVAGLSLLLVLAGAAVYKIGRRKRG
jgi:amino acid transporter